MTALAVLRTPLGPISVEATDRGVCGVRRVKARALRGRPAISALERRHLESGLAALRDYFDGRDPVVPPLDFTSGSEFDRRVWRSLLEIPWGETRTYGEVARRIGSPGSARAVGGANGRNPMAILVPCHRVVAAGGRLGGYGGGLDMKRWLLAHESGRALALR